MAEIQPSSPVTREASNCGEDFRSVLDAEAAELLLHADKLKELKNFREELQQCDTDTDRFQLCTNARSELLQRHADVELLIIAFDQVMCAECEQYKEYKARKSRQPKGSKRTNEDDEEEWERFIGVAVNGSDIISKCLAPLKAVSRCWGPEKVQHYKWARGQKFCKILCAGANQNPDWEKDARPKLQQLQLRRITIPGRRRLRESEDPLDQTDLVNLATWKKKEPFTKDKDPERQLLPFREVGKEELPTGYGFDKYGLIVRVQFADPEYSSTSPPNATNDRTELNSPSDSVLNAAIDRSIEALNCDSQTLHDDQRALTEEQAEKDSDTGDLFDDEDQDNSRHEDRAESLEIEEDAQFYPSPSASGSDGNAVSRRPQRVTNQPIYKESLNRRSRTIQHRKISRHSGKSSQTCCPANIPTELLSALSPTTHESVYAHANIAQRYAHLKEDLCHRHLLAFAQLMFIAAYPRKNKQVGVTSRAIIDDDNSFTIVPRRRSASMSEIINIPSQKRRKLDGLEGYTTSGQAVHGKVITSDQQTTRNSNLVVPGVSTSPPRTQHRDQGLNPRLLLKEFLEDPHPSVQHITKAFQRAIDAAGGLSNLTSNRPIDSPMVFKASECWKDRPSKDQYLTFLLDSFDQSRDSVYLRDRPNEPMTGAPIGTVVRQMFQPEPERTCYATNLSHEKANMCVPTTLSTQLDIYKEPELVTTVNITPKYTHIDLHVDYGHVLTNSWGVKLWALYRPTDKNYQLYEQAITSDRKFVHLSRELELPILVLTTEDDALWIPNRWLHATANITGGLTPGLQFHTSRSLKSSANLLDLDLRTSEMITEASLTALLQSIIVTLGSSEREQAQEQLCRKYALCSSRKKFPAFEEVKTLVDRCCSFCGKEWGQHRK